MNKYLVEIRENVPNSTPENFLCQADDKEHALEQATDWAGCLQFTNFVCRVFLLTEVMQTGGQTLQPAPTTPPNGSRPVEALRDEGYAVVVFDPDELRGANPRRVADSLVERGWEIIDILATEPNPADMGGDVSALASPKPETVRRDIYSWRAEFFPEFNVATMTRLEIAEHSLNKWIGLREENLKKHNCRYYDGVFGAVWNIAERKDIVIKEAHQSGAVTLGSSTCSLCEAYYTPTFRAGAGTPCDACPLAQVRRGVPCDIVATDLSEPEELPPYLHMRRYSDPEPMIAWLQKVVEAEKEKAASNG